MKKFQTESLPALRQTRDVQFDLVQGMSPTLTMYEDAASDNNGIDVDVGSWSSDVIVEYLKSKLTPSPDASSRSSRDEL